MIGVLAQATRTDFFRQLGHYVRQNESGSSQGLVLALGIAVMLGSAYYVWRWQQRASQDVSGRSLLAQLGGVVGLSFSQRRLLWKMGRAADMEPAAALISPQLLTQLMRRSEEAGLTLSPRQAICAGQILDAVAAAAGAGKPPPA